MKFILPRLLGLALLAGIASFVLAMIFKLLIGVVMTGAVVYLAMRIAGKWYRRDRQLSYDPEMTGRYGYEVMPSSPFGHPAASTGRRFTQPAIIPIN